MTTERQQILSTASSHLAHHDSRLAAIIEQIGPCAIEPHSQYYRELVESIVSQQLSVKAAATIFKRFTDLFGGEVPEPAVMLSTSIDDLRAVGLSRSKASYVLDLAQHIVDGQLRLERLPDLSNEEVVRELVAVKGIGEWTAHMFLIFSLGRLDVLATGDLGVRMAMMRLYALPTPPSPADMRAIAEQNSWHPYESVACWYLWQSLDNAPQPNVKG